MSLFKGYAQKTNLEGNLLKGEDPSHKILEEGRRYLSQWKDVAQGESESQRRYLEGLERKYQLEKADREMGNDLERYYAGNFKKAIATRNETLINNAKQQQIWNDKRTKELALLRALGTSRRQVYRLVLSESLFMSIIGSALGIGLGIGLAVLVKEGLNRFNFGLPEGPLVLTPSAAIIGAVVGVSVTVLSSLLPAIRASKVSPMEAIREGFSQPKKKSLVKRLLVGLLTTSLGFTLLFGTIFDFFEVPGLSSLRQVGIGAAITFVGIAILAPSFSKPFISLFHYIYIFFFKILGKLSIENSKRTPRRTAATASALMIGLTLITLANVITTSFKAQSESLIKGVVLADYQISAAQVFVSPGVPAGLGEELLKLEEVTELGRVRATVAAFEDSPILLGGVDEAIFNLIKTKDISGDINKFREENTLGVLKQKAERDNLSIGDSLTLYIPEEGEINFEIGYIFDWTTPPPAELFLLLDNYDFLKNETLDTEIYLNVKEKNDSTYNKIDSLVNEYPGVAFRDQDGLIEEANTQIQSLLASILMHIQIQQLRE